MLPFASAEAFLNSDRLHETDCVVSDVQMPGMNGIELQSKLIVQGYRLPIIFVTAFSEMRARTQALSAGAIGYFVVWAAFSLFATLTQWALECAGLLDAAMASTSNLVGGVIFVAAGSYQWTRLKGICLAQCQMPFAFLIRHGGFRRDAPGALMLGLRYGAYCVGCCWMLMALLFVGGVMNVLWIGLLALVILLEKVIPWARVAYLDGVVFVAAGAWLLSSAMF